MICTASRYNIQSTTQSIVAAFLNTELYYSVQFSFKMQIKVPFNLTRSVTNSIVINHTTAASCPIQAAV